MFLDRLLATNRPLVNAAFELHQSGELLPDTYILDLDMITRNAETMKGEADRKGISLDYQCICTAGVCICGPCEAACGH